MSTRTTIAIGVAAAVVAIGAAVGVGALAANLAGNRDDSRQAGYGQGGVGGNDRGTGRGGMDTSRLANDLAAKLGVDETEVASALQEVMSAVRPTGVPSGQASGPPPSRPTADRNGGPDGRGGQFLETLARGLAERLNLDEATVLTALQEVWQNQGGPGQPTRK